MHWGKLGFISNDYFFIYFLFCHFLLFPSIYFSFLYFVFSIFSGTFMRTLYIRSYALLYGAICYCQSFFRSVTTLFCFSNKKNISGEEWPFVGYLRRLIILNRGISFSCLCYAICCHKLKHVFTSIKLQNLWSSFERLKGLKAVSCDLFLLMARIHMDWNLIRLPNFCISNYFIPE